MKCGEREDEGHVWWAASFSRCAGAGGSSIILVKVLVVKIVVIIIEMVT